MTHLHPEPDQTIARVLTALRDAEAPTGLEARIAHRLRETAETRASSTRSSASLFAVILNAVKDPRILLEAAPRYALVLTAFTGLLLLARAVSHLHRPTTTAILTQQPPTATTQPQPPHLAITRIPRPQPTFHRQPATDIQQPAPSSDQLALEETLAPSQPTAPLPLTAQERLLLRATRPGTPIQVAELEQLRAPFLRSAAEARERAGLHQYLQGLLGPLATAHALEPDPQPPNDPQPLLDPEPPSPSSH